MIKDINLNYVIIGIYTGIFICSKHLTVPPIIGYYKRTRLVQAGSGLILLVIIRRINKSKFIRTMENISLTKKEEQSIKAVLLKSIHKVAEKVKEGYLVWIPEFKEIVEKSSQEYPLWLSVDSINYIHNDEWFPTIEVYCSYYRKTSLEPVSICVALQVNLKIRPQFPMP